MYPGFTVPLDSIHGAREYFYQRARWKLAFAWLPHRCAISNRLIWLKFAYLGEARWHGPGDDAVEYNWHESTEHLIWCLRRG